MDVSLSLMEGEWVSCQVPTSLAGALHTTYRPKQTDDMEAERAEESGSAGEVSTVLAICSISGIAMPGLLIVSIAKQFVPLHMVNHHTGGSLRQPQPRTEHKGPHHSRSKTNCKTINNRDSQVVTNHATGRSDHSLSIRERHGNVCFLRPMVDCEGQLVL